MNRRHGLPMSLYSAGLALLLWIAPCHAAQLRDIRIGEYENFTRIVFEFDTEVAEEQVLSPEPGQLRVSFPDIQPELIRKIPVERSNRIKEILLWLRGNRLTAVIHLAFRQIRFDSFKLNSPPRLVVDIFIPSLDAGAIKTPQPQATNSALPPSNAISGTAPPIAEEAGKIPQTNRLDASRASSPPVSGNTGPSDESVPQTGREPMPLMPSLSDLSPTPKTDETAGPDTAAQKALAQPAGNSLQYYLLVALVALTIVILTMLVLMLLSRHKWMDRKKSLQADRLLDRQDEHLASLNAQIEEQLKRYDEA